MVVWKGERRCDFYDQSHLAGHFKKALGTIPNPYRQDARLGFC